MTWAQRYLLRENLKQSLWPVPLVAMALAVVAWWLARWFDNATQWPWLNLGPEGARAVISTLLAALLTFIVFVFSMLLLVVQLASAQLTPRIITRTFNDKGVKIALGVLAFTFTFCLAIVGRIDERVPQFPVMLGGWGSLICIAMFIVLIDRVGKLLRPVTILTGIGSSGYAVIQQVYHTLLAGSPENARAAGPALGEATRTVVSYRYPGVLLAFHAKGLLETAIRHDCVIEFVPQVGDFIPAGEPLFRIYGSSPLPDDAFRSLVAIGPARTMHQDPAFAFRILVDIASKALSPAINDPTTAVLSLDQIHFLLRQIGLRHLDPGHIPDQQGKVRLIYRTPDWEDFVVLATTEIRHFGATSVQVLRRLRSMLEQLMRVLPAERQPALRTELELLTRTIERTYPDPIDQLRAGASDTQGMGAEQESNNP